MLIPVKISMRFETLIDKHFDRKFIIIGCGMSALAVKDLDLGDILTIGVNDAGGVRPLDYLTIVDALGQFTPDRLKTIIGTACSGFIAVNSDFDKHFKNVPTYKIELGDLNLSHLDKYLYPNKIDYSNTSTYMAVIEAYKMGASEIGIIGLDFTANHYNMEDGEHKLVAKYNQFDLINLGYGSLRTKLYELGVDFYNLSDISRIDTIPKMKLSNFIDSRKCFCPGSQNRARTVCARCRHT